MKFLDIEKLFLAPLLHISTIFSYRLPTDMEVCHTLGLELHISNNVEKHNIKHWYVELFTKYNVSLVDNELNRLENKKTIR